MSTLDTSANKESKKRKVTNRNYENVRTVVELDSEGDIHSDSSRLNSRRLPPLEENDARRQERKQDMELPLKSPTISEVSRQQKLKARTESQEILVHEDDKISKTIPMQPNKKKRRKRMSQSEVGTSNIGLATELYDLSEDVVPAENNIKSYNDHVFTVPVMRSEPVSKVFIEKKNGFKARDKAKVTQQRVEAREHQQALAAAAIAGPISKQNTIEFALATHRIFKIISVFLQGLFAGIALWQIIASYVLFNAGSTVFLTNYCILASPVQCLFYFLFAVSTVAVLDRYDLARPTRTLFIKSITLQAGTIAVCFYFIGLVFSLATVFIDDRITLYCIDPRLWINGTQTEDTDTYLFQWQILNLIRGITTILGWFIVSLRPSTDRLTKNLLSADENFLAPVTRAA